MLARERLWWNANKTKLHPEGHPKAATLYAAPGHEIPESAAKKYKLVDGYLKGGAAAKAAEEKAADKGEDKRGGLTINKADKE